MSELLGELEIQLPISLGPYTDAEIQAFLNNEPNPANLVNRRQRA